MLDPRRSSPGRPSPPEDRSEIPHCGARSTRRAALGELLRWAGLASLVSATASTLGCPGEAPIPRTVSLPLAALSGGRRHRVLLLGNPVEVRRTASGVAARSLLCTHQGCEVKWNGALSRYLCPCHQGTYNDEGVPIAGAPSRPLAAIPARIVGDQVVVGEETTG